MLSKIFVHADGDAFMVGLCNKARGADYIHCGIAAAAVTATLGADKDYWNIDVFKHKCKSGGSVVQGVCTVGDDYAFGFFFLFELFFYRFCNHVVMPEAHAFALDVCNKDAADPAD